MIGTGESVAGMSAAALATVINSGAPSFAERPDGSIDSKWRAQLIDKAGTTKGNLASSRVLYGSVAVNQPALLPATSHKRAGREAMDAAVPGATILKLAETSARLLTTGEANINTVQNTSSQGAHHQHGQTSAVQNMGEGYSKDQAGRVRKLLIDARSSQETEFAQAELLKEAEDRLAGKEQLYDRNRGGYKKGEKGYRDDKHGKLEIGTYGNGLLASWPLHKAGPIENIPGRTYRDYAMLDILQGARKEHDKAIQEASSTYKRYTEARAIRASKAIKDKNLTENAINLVNNLASTMEQAHGKAREELKKSEEEAKVAKDATLRGMKETSGIPTKPDKAVPKLSNYAHESLDFIKREQPPRTLLQIIEEEADLRSSRVSRYNNYTHKDDPWKYSGTKKLDQPLDYNM